MQPELIITPFGESADSATVRDIPQSNPSGAPRQNASWEQGFPLITMTPIAAGGIPPEGPDMNGVLRAISRHASFVGGGGQYKWSAEYVAAKGGYPKGAVIQADNGEVSYVSTEDGNSTNFNAYPDSIGKQWVFFGGATSYFELQFEQEQEKRENEFNQFLINTAFEMPPIPFVDGSILEISRPTQLVSHEGQLYSVRMPASFPVILSDIWDVAVASLTPRSDEALRQQLGGPDGDEIVGSTRKSPEITARTVGERLDLAPLHLYEFTDLVTDRPTLSDPKTWDWSPAIQALWDASDAYGLKGVMPKGLFRYKKQLTPRFGMDIEGSKGSEIRWAGSDAYAIFSNTSLDGAGVKKVKFTTETGGQLWYSSAPGGSLKNISLKKCYFDFSGATQEGFLLNGVRFDDVDDFQALGCKFSGAWRDHAFNSGSPGGGGGNNTVRDLEVRGKNVTIDGCRHQNSWAAQYLGNVTNLLTTRNRIEDTADSAIFDRCTSGISTKKRITYNDFKNIGKSPIKTLDSNNRDTTNKGYDSIVAYNTIENWGLYIASGAILAGTGFTTSYDRVPSRDYMCKDLTIAYNKFKGTGELLLQVYNILDVKYVGNTADVDADVTFGAYCDGIKISGSNVIRTSKRISIFSSSRVGIFESDFESPGAFLFSGSASQPFTGTIRFSGNHVNNTAATPPERFFGLGVTGGNFNVTVIGSDNIFETKLAFSDASESTSYNLASFANAGGSQWVLTDNIVKFSDSVKSQVQMLGDIGFPVYYSGSLGAAKIQSPGTIRFAKSNSRNDFGTITYNA